MTHLHTIGNVQTRDPGLCRVEIRPEYHPSIVLLFTRGTNKDTALARLQASEFRFGRNVVSRVEAIELGNTQSRNKSTYTQFYMVIRTGHTAEAVHKALRDFFEWTGNVPKKDIITWASADGIIQQQLVVNLTSSPRWTHKLAILEGLIKPHMVRVEPAENCVICQKSWGHGVTQDIFMAIKAGAYKVPAARFPSLKHVTMSSYVADFAGVNGADAFKSVQAQDLVRAFNSFADFHYPNSNYDDKLLALSRVLRRYLACQYRTLTILQVGTTLPFPAFARLHQHLQIHRNLLTDNFNPLRSDFDGNSASLSSDTDGKDDSLSSGSDDSDDRIASDSKSNTMKRKVSLIPHASPSADSWHSASPLTIAQLIQEYCELQVGRRRWEWRRIQRHQRVRGQ